MPISPRPASLRGQHGLVAALALVLGAAPALAQNPAPTPVQPRPRPAAPAPAAPAAPAPAAPAAGAPPAAPTGPTVVQVKAEPSQPEWTKVCGKDQGNGTEICYTTRDFVSDQGQPVLAVAVYDVKGAQAQKIVRFLMPLGLLLCRASASPSTRVQAISGKYAICFPNGCFAEAPVKDDFIAAVKKGSTLNVSVQNPGPRGHLRGSARRLRQGLRRRADRSEGP